MSIVTAAVDIANMALQRLGEPVIMTLTESSRNANIVNQLYGPNRDYCIMLADWDCLVQRAVLTRSGKVSVTGATAADPVVLSVTTGHVFINNELVFVQSLGGMTQVNDATFRVFASTSTTITLYDLDGTSTDGTGYTAWTSGGFVYRDPGTNFAYVYDLPSDCLKVLEIMDEEFGQSNDYTWRKERNFIFTDLIAAGVKYIKQVTDASLYEADLVDVIASRLAWLISMRTLSDKNLRASLYAELNASIARAKMTNAQGKEDEGRPEALWAEAHK